ncbi:TPM domain-containing protein [Paenibacillus puerhi]|uniref:TPM domain-containing protein n=1 Tax=Paenibacillus puerhi TaxID=2692622 RepID=UPI001356E6F1|nr:TPM domain-containing protein [Paenibacillus puerhi]
MKRYRWLLALLLFCAVIVAVPMELAASEAAPAKLKQLIIDDAGLLTREEAAELNALANQYGAERETDILIVTSKNAANQDVKKMTQDFYDEHGPGYDKPHGNAVILMLDMKNREIYLAGFYKAKEYLDNGRLDKIRNRISPELTSGDYGLAFREFILTAHRYMGFRPGVNPDNILFEVWFQLAASLVLGGIIVGTMAYHSGGRVTVHRHTYEDTGTSGVLEHQDQYVRTTTTRQKIEKNSGGGGSGGGGGTTGGGHSHSGSRGSF